MSIGRRPRRPGRFSNGRDWSATAGSDDVRRRVSQALAVENRALGIHVCALCPGFTRSEFHDVSQARKLVSKLPDWMWSDAHDVVRQGLDAMERGRVVCVPGRANRAIKVLMDLLPDRVALGLVARRAKHFRIRD